MKKTIQVLKIIFMLLAILTMMCTLAKKASAEGADTASYYDYIHSITDNWQVSDRNAFNSMLDGCINSNYWFVTNGSNWIGFCPKPSFGLISEFSRGTFIPSGVGYNESLYPGWQNSFPMYVFQTFYGGSVGVKIDDYTNGQNTLPMRYSWTGSFIKTNYDFGQSGTNMFIYNDVWYGNVDSFYEIYGSRGTGYSSGWSVYQLTVERPVPEYTEDSRLKFSTSLRGDGEKLLNTDLSNFLQWSPTSGMTVSDLVLTFDCDGDEITVELDDNNSEIIFTKNELNYTYRCVYITPYSEFGLDDYNNVSIVKCGFTRNYSHLGPSGPVDEVENFKIACDYVLKVYVNPIAPADIEEPVYDDPAVIPQSEISDTIEMLKESSSSAPNAFSGDWVYEQNHPVVPSWADNYDFRVIYSDDNSFVGNLVNSNVWNYYTDNNPNGLDWLTGSFMPRKFVFENSAFAFYDMIIISVYSANVALSPDNLNILMYNNIELQGYIVFYSERFYIHQQAITQQNLLSSLEYIGYNANLYYGYMYDQLQDFEFKNLLAMGSLIDYAKNGNIWLSTIDSDINNNTADIITAIKNNKFVPDYSSLIAEMELIKSAVLSVPVSVRSDLVYLFMPTYDGISANFQQYHDDIGILALPFDETKLVYDTMKNNYTGNFEIDVPELKFQGFTLYDGMHFSFNVWSLFDGDKLSSSDGTGLGFVKGLRYFIAFLAIYGSVASTYAHIFRRENTQD